MNDIMLKNCLKSLFPRDKKPRRRERLGAAAAMRVGEKGSATSY